MEKSTEQLNDQPENEQPEEEKNLLIEGLKGIGFGIVLFGVAYYFYTTMTDYENGESISMNRLLLLAYGILGKTIPTVILGLFGALMLYSGATEIISSRKE